MSTAALLTTTKKVEKFLEAMAALGQSSHVRLPIVAQNFGQAIPESTMDLFSDSEGSGSGSDAGRIDIVEEYSDDDKPEQGLKINKDYAARFEHNKAREELQRLESKYGKDVAARMLEDRNTSDMSDSSDDESEDEEGEQMTADVDAAILSTLAKIRQKDESIYDAGKRVFDEERQHASSSKLLPRRLQRGTQPDKGVSLSTYQRKRIQELMKTSDDPARDLADATAVQRRSDERGQYGDDGSAPLPYSKEQERLREEVKQAFHSVDEADSRVEGEELDDFLQRKAGDSGIDKDPEAYKRFLVDVLGGKEDSLRDLLTEQRDEAAAGTSSGAAGVAESSRKANKPSKHGKRKNADATQNDDDFLVNYVLNRGWIDNPSAAPKMPAHDGDAEASDDSFEDRADDYETAYNFRFQELEDADTNPQIQSYSRQIEGSVRRKEEKRKREREERALRKREEKERKKSELNRLRDLKRKSIVDKLKALKEATGSTAVDFKNFDLEGDFDPDEHDRLMADAFNDAYYGEDDEQKPTFSDDSELEAILNESDDDDQRQKGKSEGGTAQKRKKEKKEKRKKASAEASALAGDANDAEGGEAVDEGNTMAGKKLSKAEKKKLKKREKAKARKAEEAGAAGEQSDEAGVDVTEMDADAIDTREFEGLSREQRKKRRDEMMDEYYGLEYEDVIGDQPTRFKYAQVPKSDFGMTAEEILMADDADLNKIISLKRLQPYRRGRQRPADLNARLKEFRRNQTNRSENGPASEEQPKSKRPGKRERERKSKAKEAAASNGTNGVSEGNETASNGKAPGKDSAAGDGSGQGDSGKAKEAKPRKHKKHKTEKVTGST